nr:hypothetical protein [Methanosarcina horonobensis]
MEGGNFFPLSSYSFFHSRRSIRTSFFKGT